MSVQLIAASALKAEQPDVPGKRTVWLSRAHALLNHDFCPSFNRWVYWLKNPLWCLALAASLSLVCGIFLSPAALFITAILILLTAIGVALPWLTIKGINAHLTFDIRRSRVGQPVLIRLRVTNRWPWPVWGLSIVRGFALSNDADTVEGVSLTRVPGWSTVEYTWSFVPRVRGRYPLVPAMVETGFPFGLYRASRSATVDGYVVVWPKTVALSGLPDAADMRQSDDQLAERRVGEFGDMLGTRLFRQGDSLRRVHWAQTARQQHLIVCERQAPATSSVHVRVDLNPESHAQCDPERRHAEDSVELAVQVAASVCEALHRQHCRVELQIGDHKFAVGEVAAGFQRMMDALAQASLCKDSLNRDSRGAAGGFAIVITTPLGLRHLAHQLNRHHVISVSDGSAMQKSVPVHRPWIELRDASDVMTRLSACWKGACNVR